MRGSTVQADGERIAELRAELGWSQQKLGVEAGIHNQTISKVERSSETKAVTEIGTIWRLAQTFSEHLGRPVAVEDLILPDPDRAAS